jgi:hypothetical protein
VEDQPIDGQPVVLDLPSGGGTTVITLSTTGNSPQTARAVALRNFRWSWQPKENR